MPSVLWRCWLGIRKSIWPAKEFCDGVLVWLSIWSKMQIVYIWSSWCLCIPKPRQSSSVASFKSRLDLPFWYRLTQIVLDKRSLNRCSSSTHTHTFNGSLSGTTRVGRYQKGKTNLDFTEARDSEWQWHQLGHMQVCTSLQTDNHASTPPLSFCRPDALPAAQPAASKHWRGKGGVVGAAAKVEMT